jgi:hypothetical protein
MPSGLSKDLFYIHSKKSEVMERIITLQHIVLLLSFLTAVNYITFYQIDLLSHSNFFMRLKAVTAKFCCNRTHPIYNLLKILAKSHSAKATSIV